jgi:hypothetical protein
VRPEAADGPCAVNAFVEEVRMIAVRAAKENFMVFLCQLVNEFMLKVR